MKKTIAIYQSVEYKWMQHVGDVHEYGKHTDRIRVSEIETVHFKMLPGSFDSEINKRAVAAAQKEFDAAKAKLDGLMNG